MCNATECPQAESCLRHLAYEHTDGEEPFLSLLNPKWLAKQKGVCNSNEPGATERQ